MELATTGGLNNPVYIFAVCTTLNTLCFKLLNPFSAITVEIIVLNEAGNRSTFQEPCYILGSTVTLICYTPTATEPLSYLWSSTSEDFFAHNSTSMFNKKRLLSSADAGIHTCTVTDAHGNSGQGTVEMKFNGTLQVYDHSL